MTIARTSSRLFRQEVRECFCGQVRCRTPTRYSTVFRGWPIFAFAPEEGATRTAQKCGFFRAVQPAQIVTRRLSIKAGGAHNSYSRDNGKVCHSCNGRGWISGCRTRCRTLRCYYAARGLHFPTSGCFTNVASVERILYVIFYRINEQRVRTVLAARAIIVGPQPSAFLHQQLNGHQR
jgi:hypothetical protein